MAVSVFDLFKIGIGPSSSHTVGPMRAARLFALRLQQEGLLPRVQRVQADLYGSLGATGKGHGSDKAVLLGLLGHEPDTVEVEAIPALLKAVRDSGRLKLAGAHAVEFAEKRDLLFHRRESLPLHANGMRFAAFDAAGAELQARVYYSVGGGFVVNHDEAAADRIVPDATPLPHPFTTGDELLQECAEDCEQDNQRCRDIDRDTEDAFQRDESAAHIDTLFIARAGIWPPRGCVPPACARSSGCRRLWPQSIAGRTPAA